MDWGDTEMLADLRKDYTFAGLHEDDADPDPFKQFLAWFQQAQDAMGHEPNAMTLATASPDGEPSARTVLLKGLDHGFIFYSNYLSEKGTQLEANPRAELMFYWPEMERQVRIRGEVERLPASETEQYFRSRPRGSQMGAVVSPQSTVIASRQVIEEAFAAFEREHEGKEVPLPEHWGGYRVTPVAIEFWQGRVSRLHDRLRYRRNQNGDWLIERLAP